MRAWEFMIDSNVEYKGQIVWVVGISGDENWLMLQDLKRSGASFKVYMDDKLLKAIELSPDLLVSMGFAKMDAHSWCGNGQDYQVPPEEGGSRTTQVDYVKYNVRGDRDLIIRFQSYEYGNTAAESEVQMFIDEWYPGCSDEQIYVSRWELHRLQGFSNTVLGENHFTIKL